MNLKLLPLLIALAWLQPLAAETLNIRMIRGCHEVEETPHELNDIATTLQKTLAFKGYLLDATATVNLPADEAKATLRIYEVTCSGTAERLTIKIMRRNKTILDTVATVRPGRPVILGGFPARNNEGVRMFVLTVAP